MGGGRWRSRGGGARLRRQCGSRCWSRGCRPPERRPVVRQAQSQSGKILTSQKHLRHRRRPPQRARRPAGTVLLCPSVPTPKPGIPILAIFRLKGQPKRDGSIIVRSCRASQSPVYPIRDAILAVNHASCPSLSSSGPPSGLVRFWPGSPRLMVPAPGFRGPMATRQDERRLLHNGGRRQG